MPIHRGYGYIVLLVDLGSQPTAEFNPKKQVHSIRRADPPPFRLPQSPDLMETSSALQTTDLKIEKTGGKDRTSRITKQECACNAQGRIVAFTQPRAHLIDQDVNMEISLTHAEESRNNAIGMLEAMC